MSGTHDSRLTFHDFMVHGLDADACGRHPAQLRCVGTINKLIKKISYGRRQNF
jgi:hypothetical protein